MMKKPTAAEKAAAELVAKNAAEAAGEGTEGAPVAEAAPGAGDDWDAPPAAPKPAKAVKKASEFDGPVKVRCIVHTRPFTDLKGLSMDEEATVPPEVAALMLERKQVELV